MYAVTRKCADPRKSVWGLARGCRPRPPSRGCSRKTGAKRERSVPRADLDGQANRCGIVKSALDRVAIWDTSNLLSTPAEYFPTLGIERLDYDRGRSILKKRKRKKTDAFNGTIMPQSARTGSVRIGRRSPSVSGRCTELRESRNADPILSGPPIYLSATTQFTECALTYDNLRAASRY